MPKNILFILSDQHRHDAVSMFNPDVISPALEQMASEGTCFTNCHCSSQPCVPSRASLLTGLYPEVHGLWDNDHILPESMLTWPQHLSENGYQTIAVGRTHNINKGFDRNITVPAVNSYPMNNHDLKLQVHWREDAFIHPSEAAFEDYYETRITKTAIDFLQQLKRTEAPFALYVGFCAPHTPLTPPAELWDLYHEESFSMGDEALPPDDLQQWSNGGKMINVTEERHRRILHGYYAAVSTIDRCIGMLKRALGELGLADDTLLVYTSDHGEQLGHRRLYGKGYGYDPSLKVPLLMSCPGTVPEDNLNRMMLEHIDLVPTMLEAIGVPPMPSSGRSFWQSLTAGGGLHRDWIYSSWDKGQIFKDEKYKWICRKDHKGGILDEIYDISETPREQYEVSDKEIRENVKSSFTERYHKFSMEHFRSNIKDFSPQSTQPPLRPFLST